MASTSSSHFANPKNAFALYVCHACRGGVVSISIALPSHAEQSYLLCIFVFLVTHLDTVVAIVELYFRHLETHRPITLSLFICAALFFIFFFPTCFFCFYVQTTFLLVLSFLT